MWHLKTRLGLFWVIPVSETSNRYFLGVNDHALGEYQNADQAARDVYNQSTGYFRWDAEAKIRVPAHINEWQEGEPQDWQLQ